MASRRRFLGGLIAAGLCPAPTWADAGHPSYLSAAKRADGRYALFGLSNTGDIAFEIDLPDRGHAAAAHPFLAQAVAFARRPGTFALVIDCVSGQEMQRLTAPAGRHFYGHGVFSADGKLLFTTENDYENVEGRVGVWDARQGYRRIAEFHSGGVGPHEIRLMPDGQRLVIANGGIETHPDSGRTKLNIATMQPNLSYVSRDGRLIEQHSLPDKWHKASIRHLAVRPDGLVAIACQWQGGETAAPLMHSHRMGHAIQPISTTDENPFQGYIGSIAFSAEGTTIAATSPRANSAVLYHTAERSFQTLTLTDVCGVAPGAIQKSGITMTTGDGSFLTLDGTNTTTKHNENLSWDNHLVAL